MKRFRGKAKSIARKAAMAERALADIDGWLAGDGAGDPEPTA